MSRSIQRVYVEREIADHPRTRQVLARFPNAERISCERYGEVFNRKAQDFRLQKKRPALILARKHDHFVLPAPEGYGIGGQQNFYFSHMLNCIYDCRYCFLQGMYRSAHYVLFVNYEDFHRAMRNRLAEADGDDVYFFSGYDCDSLALDSVTGFVGEFLPFLEREPRAWLELRTKSTAVDGLLSATPAPKCVVAFSFTPEEAHRRLENGVPSIGNRLRAMAKLAERGWRLGLRFDPLLYREGFLDDYRQLFERVFAVVPEESLHSVSLGPFRLPKPFYDTLYRLHPEDRLIAGPLDVRGRMVSYPDELERELVGAVTRELSRWVPAERFFPCPVT